MVQAAQVKTFQAPSKIKSQNQKVSKDDGLKAKLLVAIAPLRNFFMKFSPRERIAYPLIVVGVIFIIIGIILW